MFITELSIKRPAVSWVMSLILIIFGLFVFWKLPVRELPDGIQPPVVQVQVNYKSAAASIIDQEVTQVMEDVIGGAEGIKNIDSKSENGRSTINIEFDTSIDLDNAANDIRERVSRVVDNLPSESDPPQILKRAAGFTTTMWLSLSSKTWSDLELGDYAERFLIDQFSSVKNVGRILVGGLRELSIRVWIDPIKLAANDLTIQEVENALRGENIRLPAGTLEANNIDLTLNKRTPLISAIEYNSTEAAYKLILKGASLDQLRGAKTTPLIAACNRANETVIDLLLLKGVDINQKDKGGATAIHALADGSVHADKKLSILKKFVSEGANINEIASRYAPGDDSESFVTPLDIAYDEMNTDNGRLDFLIENGAKTPAQVLDDRLSSLEQKVEQGSSGNTNPTSEWPRKMWEIDLGRNLQRDAGYFTITPGKNKAILIEDVHFEGDNNSKTIVDRGISKISNCSCIGNAEISSDQYKFGGTSLYLSLIHI